MILATSRLISRADLATIHKNFTIFIEYYEQDVYQYKWGHLSTMLSVYHHLIHIVDYIELAGPAWVFWQFPMERIVGLLVRWVQSRAHANQNLAKIILQ